MILDRKELRNNLFGLVGFYQTNNPDYPTINPSLLTTRSGRYFNEAHYLLNDLENIDQSAKNFSNYSYPAFNVGNEYSLGQKVQESGINYEYINSTPSTGNTPPNPTFWREIDEINDLLTKIVYQSIDQMSDDWINDKKVRTIIKSIYDQILLFSGSANYKDITANANNYVGLRLRMKRGERSLVTIINKIGHQFTGNFSDLPITIYHSSQQLPIATFLISQTKAGSFQWTTLTENNLLRYLSDDYDGGGEFFIGYKQSDLEARGAKAYRMDYRWGKSPCNCGDYVDYNYYKQRSAFIDVIGFEIAESNFGAGGEIFNPQEVGIKATDNYGLNLNLSNKCDIGYFISQEEDLFAEALQYKAGLKLLEILAYGTRGGNSVANQVREKARTELFTTTGFNGTVKDKYEKAIKALTFDISGLAEECLACDDRTAKVILGNATMR